MSTDTDNTFCVGVAGDRVRIQGVARLYDKNGFLSRDEALALAAWLVAIADPGGERFQRVLEEVRNT